MLAGLHHGGVSAHPPTSGTSSSLPGTGGGSLVATAGGSDHPLTRSNERAGLSRAGGRLSPPPRGSGSSGVAAAPKILGNKNFLANRQPLMRAPPCLPATGAVHNNVPGGALGATGSLGPGLGGALAGLFFGCKSPPSTARSSAPNSARPPGTDVKLPDELLDSSASTGAQGTTAKNGFLSLASAGSSPLPGRDHTASGRPTAHHADPQHSLPASAGPGTVSGSGGVGTVSGDQQLLGDNFDAGRGNATRRQSPPVAEGRTRSSPTFCSRGTLAERNEAARENFAQRTAPTGVVGCSSAS